MAELTQLHDDIAARVSSIRSGQPDWLCRRGCDGCCRRLAEIPRLTADEWALLRVGLAALPAEQLLELAQALAELAGQTARPIICPLLELASGACRVYAYRPVACRTYGFYVQRELGLYCHDIQARVADGMLADVVWGNQDAVDHRLQGLGVSLELTEWFKRWQAGEDNA
ncbi:MAG: YkgJ family cysteine cluster protein [Methylococcaceae bacterium]|jgi:Fe-S-cluster containining protein